MASAAAWARRLCPSWPLCEPRRRSRGGGAGVGASVGPGVGAAVGLGVGSGMGVDAGAGARLGPVVGLGVGAGSHGVGTLCAKLFRRGAVHVLLACRSGAPLGRQRRSFDAHTAPCSLICLSAAGRWASEGSSAWSTPSPRSAARAGATPRAWRSSGCGGRPCGRRTRRSRRRRRCRRCTPRAGTNGPPLRSSRRWRPCSPAEPARAAGCSSCAAAAPWQRIARMPRSSRARASDEAPLAQRPTVAAPPSAEQRWPAPPWGPHAQLHAYMDDPRTSQVVQHARVA